MHLVANGWFWGQMATGSGQYLHDLARWLPAAEPSHRFTLVTPAAVESAVPAGWQALVAPPAVRRLGQNVAKLWFEQVGFPRACQRLSADVAFTPYWGASWRRPCPTAVTVHDLIPLLLPAYRGGVPQRAYTWLVSRTARRADLVLTDSQASRQDIMQHLGIPAERVKAVLLAADERFQPVTDPAELARVRERYALPARFILYLGGFDVRKNVAGLVRAYARMSEQAKMPSFGKDGIFACSDMRLLLAGKLPTSDTPFTPDPRRIAAQEGIADLVHFAGWVDETDKPALYSLASLFVFPSLYEGYGLPVAEAAACGAPVVTSNRSSLPEVAPGVALVDPEDESALAAAMLHSLAGPRPPASIPCRTWLDVARETLNHLKELP